MSTQFFFRNVLSIALIGFLILASGCQEQGGKGKVVAKKPNILFAISDDQSYPFASAYGNAMVQTPVFDAIADRGTLFQNVFCAAPQCSPNRAAILTGKNIWQLEEAGTHASYFPAKFSVFTDALEKGGYRLGYTGKAWGPGNWKDSGWSRNPVGPEFNDLKLEMVPASGISRTDYAGNFEVFLENQPKEQPFFFWYGSFEPHRVYEEESGQHAGKELQDAVVPPFLPDVPEVRNDLLDYALEIEWFDQQLGKMIEKLKETGELDNTIIIVTADNGMAFPYAKANLQEYGIHVPLAVCGPGIKGSRTSDALISHIDLAPTILELARIPALESATGHSFASLLLDSAQAWVSRDWIVAGRERHTHARPDNLGYPARAIRTNEYLYIQNLKPDLWPAGDPEITEIIENEDGSTKKIIQPAYFDIDASPTKEYIRLNHIEFPQYFQLGFGKRPAEELFDIRTDPGCLQNLALDEIHKNVRNNLREQLMVILTDEEDPRILGEGDIFDSYPRVSPMRHFPGFKEQSTYNPAFQKKDQ